MACSCKTKIDIRALDVIPGSVGYLFRKVTPTTQVI